MLLEFDGLDTPIGPSTPRGFRLGGNQHFGEHAVDPEYATGEHARNLDRVEVITVPSLAVLPIIHIHLRYSAPATSMSAKPPDPATTAPPNAPSFDIMGEECLLQDILTDKVFFQGVCTPRARRPRGQELVKAQPNIRLSAAGVAGLLRKECECAAGVVKAAVAEVLGKHK
ncbi:hypothetical protein H4582DRAFT_2100038 [Lactarius indigo]|nr:hypothetical protein H4582DRAFT_2100038 [Lactarius indigo]